MRKKKHKNHQNQTRPSHPLHFSQTMIKVYKATKQQHQGEIQGFQKQPRVSHWRHLAYRRVWRVFGKVGTSSGRTPSNGQDNLGGRCGDSLRAVWSHRFPRTRWDTRRSFRAGPPVPGTSPPAGSPGLGAPTPTRIRVSGSNRRARQCRVRGNRGDPDSETGRRWVS